MTGFIEAFRDTRAAGRAADRPRRPRTPVLVVLGRLAGRAVAGAGRAQTALLQLGGFGLLDAAAWQAGPIPGLAAAGGALLFLDYLNGAR